MSNLTKAQKITIGIFGAFLLFLIYLYNLIINYIIKNKKRENNNTLLSLLFSIS